MFASSTSPPPQWCPLLRKSRIWAKHLSSLQWHWYYYKPLQLYSSPCGTCWWTRWAVVPVHRNPENILLFLLSRFLIYPEVTFSNTCWCCWWRGGAPRIVRGRSTVFPMFGDELIARERLGDELTVDKSIVFPDVSSVSSVAGSSWSMRTWIKIVKVTTDCIDSVHQDTTRDTKLHPLIRLWHFACVLEWLVTPCYFSDMKLPEGQRGQSLSRNLLDLLAG